MEVSGSLQDDIYAYQTNRILEQRPPPGVVWLLIDGYLTLEGESSHEWLNGTWTSGGNYGRIYLEKVDLPIASFTLSPTSGVVPLTVQFNDTSTGNPTSWNWSFGDGTYSTEKDPVHVYSEPGIYSVMLQVTNPYGNGTKIEPDLIAVEPEAAGGEIGYYLIRSNIEGASVYFTDISNETYYAGEIENGILNATIYLTATPLVSYSVEKEGYLSYAGSIEVPPAPGETIDLPSKLYSAYSWLDFEIPGVSIVTIVDGETIQYIEIDPSRFTEGSLLIEGDDVIINDPKLQFPEIIYHLSGLTVDQNITGYLEGADFTSPTLSAMLSDGEPVEPSFAISFDLLPESGSVGIGILEGEQTEEAESFFGFADSQGTPLASLKYVVEVDSASLGGELGGVYVYFRAEKAWVEVYGAENVRIYRSDNTGLITVLATEGVETTETAVTFQGYSPEGLSIFAIAAERSIPVSDGGGDSRYSRSSKDESPKNTEVQPETPPGEEPPVIEPELLSDLPFPQVPQQILPEIEPLAPARSLTPAEALISEINRISSITPGDYFTGLASSVETAAKSNYVQSPLAQALPKEACPVAAVATGIGVAGLGAALTGTAAFSFQGSAGTAADAMMGPRVPSATSQMGRAQQAARTYMQRLASRTWRSPGISRKLDRAWEFIRKFLGFETIGYLGMKEVQWRKILPRSHDPIFLGLSYRELAFAGISIGLLATAFTFAGRLNVTITTVLLFIFMGAIAVIGHELVTNIIARQNQCDSEFRMWGLGALILFANAGLFGLAFGKPSRTLVAGTQHLSDRDRATLMLIGPLVNVIFALISLYLIPLGGLLGAAGAIGFPINIMLGLYALIPVHPMKGKVIFQWSRLIWAIFFIPLVILYISVYYLF
ncbi:MAG: PKD domain-containing protein [Methanomicrobiaceae archaeon]|nr:PKD domain-containing protein [Methanomicrobiaceae archaeon]